ncbi:MAG: ABC transporter substrate-binding protein, partial [Deferrisomatales bacterium]
FAAAHGEPPSYHAAAAYAAGQVIEAAAARAGSLERAGLRDALATLNATSILGRYGVDPTGRQVRHFVLTIQWQDGEQEVVWPAELRTAAPRFPAPGR